MKIPLAVDGSPSTKRMLATITAHDELLGPGHQYVALTAVPPIPAHVADFVSHDAIVSWHEEQGEAVLSPVRAFAKQNGWNFEARRVVGHAGDEIARLADEGRFDMIVMGTHGHSALVNVVMGSIATRVLALTKVPVLLVH